MNPLEHSEKIAGWGEANLVRFLDGHYELQGGTLEDRQAATKWIKQFMPKVAEELQARRGRNSQTKRAE
jgi:hypothetical protein